MKRDFFLMISCAILMLVVAFVGCLCFTNLTGAAKWYSQIIVFACEIGLCVLLSLFADRYISPKTKEIL